MQADVLVAPVPMPLTRRASLNAVQSLLDYAARLGVGLIVTPLLVSRLGRDLFGVWEMLNRLIGYMSAADGRPTEALRLVIATKQTATDAMEHRRAVGSALVVWLLFSRSEERRVGKGGRAWWSADP